MNLSSTQSAYTSRDRKGAVTLPLAAGGPSRRLAGHTPRRAAGFSLVELLVVIGIIMLVLLVAVPAANRMMADTRVAGAADAVGTAAAKTRAYATLGGSFPRGKYRGSALVITPANEMRITRHIYEAQDGGGNLLVDANRAGYADVLDQNYTMLSRNVGIVGIARPQGVNWRDPPALLTPPFAVAFSEKGQLRPSTANPLDESRVVFYDGEESGVYFTGTNRRRQADYDVSEWDPEVVGRTNQNWDPDRERYLLAFTRLEGVVGIVVYDRGAFSAAGFGADDLVSSGNGWGVRDEPESTPGDEPQNARDWILANGQVVLFNRYSGAAIKP